MPYQTEGKETSIKTHPLTTRDINIIRGYPEKLSCGRDLTVHVAPNHHDGKVWCRIETSMLWFFYVSFYFSAESGSRWLRLPRHACTNSVMITYRWANWRGWREAKFFTRGEGGHYVVSACLSALFSLFFFPLLLSFPGCDMKWALGSDIEWESKFRIMAIIMVLKVFR